ncbi:MAG: preprotein translocase subunit SecA [Alphaproteobacteria bacterium]
MFDLFSKFLGSSNDRVIKTLQKDVSAINVLEPQFEKLSDKKLQAQTPLLKKRLEKGEKLDDLLPEAFAIVREASKRVLGMRHFDVQLVGGMILHRGDITEMRTGEGKTLVATLPVYLNALSGKGVHVVTVNDYLAKRDAEWMGKIYKFLGLTFACVSHDTEDTNRKEAYNSDVLYITNNELGFDYLRDNMKHSLEDVVQREFNYAIIDEVDSILIDEARTPLIISGPTEDFSESYRHIDTFIPSLKPEDYDVDEKARSVSLTEEGVEHIEELLGGTEMLEEGGLYDAHNITTLHHVNQALRAHKLFKNNVDYLIRGGQLMIVDEFTGRVMEGRRYGEGLHQALEAKEKVNIKAENQTLASITFQNLFRLYPKLSGMTGTALTEEAEFQEIYGLGVVDIPTNLPIARLDDNDEIYRTIEQKHIAIVKQIAKCHKKGQPVLVGTVSIERSEAIAAVLKKKKIPYNILNAKHHEREAIIITQAGKPGAVTIATNMAGRGTDIQLGGNLEMAIAEMLTGKDTEKEAAKKRKELEKQIAADKKITLAAGGLYVLGTERHESRRIDNQLRGRSGRQGDPGASKFFLSLEDDLMRIFGGEKLNAFMERLGINEEEAIIHPWISKAIEKAQQRVEARNFDIRKNLLKFDNVMNDQRKVVYEQRREIMQEEDVTDILEDMRAEVIEDLIDATIPPNTYPEQWNIEALDEEAIKNLALKLPLKKWFAEEGIDKSIILERVQKASDKQVEQQAKKFAPEFVLSMQKSLILNMLDAEWKDHLLALDHLRQGISLRAYAQKDPLNEYKKEAFNLFGELLVNVRQKVVSNLCHFESQFAHIEEMLEKQQRMNRKMRATHPDAAGQIDPNFVANARGIAAPQAQHPILTHAPTAFNKEDPSTWGKTPRNATCPCGSKIKYKHCHGKLV